MPDSFIDPIQSGEVNVEGGAIFIDQFNLLLGGSSPAPGFDTETFVTFVQRHRLELLLGEMMVGGPRGV